MNIMKKQTLFTLKGIFIPTILFRLNPSFKWEKDKVEINTSVEVDYSHKGKEFTVQVRVEMPDGENAPFSFAVEGVGSFALQEEPPENVLESIARINCAAIIFPYIREAIADLTRRAGVPPLHLQPVNFVALKEEKSAEKNPEIIAPKRVATKKKVT